MAAMRDWRIPTFEHSHQDRVQLVQALFPHLDGLYAAHATEHNLVGVIYGIIIDGICVHMKTLGSARQDTAQILDGDTRFRIASMTKSFTAMAMLKLVDQGRLNLSDPLVKHVPAFGGLYLSSHSSRLTQAQSAWR